MILKSRSAYGYRLRSRILQNSSDCLNLRADVRGRLSAKRLSNLRKSEGCFYIIVVLELWNELAVVSLLIIIPEKALDVSLLSFILGCLWEARFFSIFNYAADLGYLDIVRFLKLVSMICSDYRRFAWFILK